MIAPPFPAEMILPTAVTIGAAVGGLVFGGCLSIAARLAQRRRTLTDPTCAACAMRLAAVDARMPERCPECGASLAEASATVWVRSRPLALAKSVVIAIGLVVAALAGLGAGIVARDAARGVAREGIDTTMEARLRLCERPGIEGARALRDLQRRIARDGLSVGEGIVFDRWLASLDPTVVAFGTSSPDRTDADWLRVADFVDLVVFAIEHEGTSVWVARQAIGAVLPKSRVEAPLRVRPGSLFAVRSGTGLPSTRLVVQDGGLWIGDDRIPPLPEHRQVMDDVHVRIVRAPNEPGSYRLRRAWTIDILSGTLSMPPRSDAPPSGLPRREEDTWMLEVAEGAESIAVVDDAAADPFRAEGTAMLVEVMVGERSTLIRWFGWPSATASPAGAWAIELAPEGTAAAESVWQPLVGDDPLVLTRGALVDGQPLRDRDRIRVRYTPAESPALPGDETPARRSARQAFAAERTYELVFFEERSLGSTTVLRSYRLAPLSERSRSDDRRPAN